MPHLHVFNALIMYAENSYAETLPGQAAKELIEKNYNFQQLGKMVKHARVADNYGGKTKRLEINVQENSLAEKFWVALKAELLSTSGIKEKPGMAPMGNLERELQRFLDECKESTSPE